MLEYCHVISLHIPNKCWLSINVPADNVCQTTDTISQSQLTRELWLADGWFCISLFEWCLQFAAPCWYGELLPLTQRETIKVTRLLVLFVEAVFAESLWVISCHVLPSQTLEQKVCESLGQNQTWSSCERESVSHQIYIFLLSTYESFYKTV